MVLHLLLVNMKHGLAMSVDLLCSVLWTYIRMCVYITSRQTVLPWRAQVKPRPRHNQGLRQLLLRVQLLSNRQN